MNKNYQNSLVQQFISFNHRHEMMLILKTPLIDNFYLKWYQYISQIENNRFTIKVIINA